MQTVTRSVTLLAEGAGAASFELVATDKGR
jgi:hypothetical protein